MTAPAVPSWLQQILLTNPAYNHRLRVLETIAIRIDGTDKLAKCTQYTSRLLAWYLRRFEWFAGKVAPGAGALKSLDIITGELSAIRKVMRLGKWLYSVPPVRKDLKALSKAQHNNDTSFWSAAAIDHALSCFTDFTDDLQWLSKMHILDPKLGPRAARWGHHTFFITCFFDLYFTFHELAEVQRELDAAVFDLCCREDDSIDTADSPARLAKIALVEKLTRKHQVVVAIVFKYLGDLGVATIEVFQLGDSISKGWYPFFALVSGLCSTYKLWVNTSDDVRAKGKYAAYAFTETP